MGQVEVDADGEGLCTPLWRILWEGDRRFRVSLVALVGF